MLARDAIANTLKSRDSFQGYSPVALRNIRLLFQEIGNLEPLDKLRPGCGFGRCRGSIVSTAGYRGHVIAVGSMSERCRHPNPVRRNELRPDQSLNRSVVEIWDEEENFD